MCKIVDESTKNQTSLFYIYKYIYTSRKLVRYTEKLLKMKSKE